MKKTIYILLLLVPIFSYSIDLKLGLYSNEDTKQSSQVIEEIIKKNENDKQKIEEAKEELKEEVIKETLPKETVIKENKKQVENEEKIEKVETKEKLEKKINKIDNLKKKAIYTLKEINSAYTPVERETEEQMVQKVPYDDVVYSYKFNTWFGKLDVDKKHPLASLTKVMTAVIALEYVYYGYVHLDDVITMDAQTYNIGGSWLNTRVGAKYTLSELLDALLVYSANNAAYAIAKHIGGSVDKFVELMNEKAEKIGMYQTKYYTPSGLPTSFTNKPLDESTLYDQVRLVKYILDERPELLEIATKPIIVLNDGNGKKFKYQNRNPLIKNQDLFEGKDIEILGLKTGYHSKAGYNMIGISKIYDDILVSITFGNKSDNERYLTQKNKILEYYNKIEKVIDKDEYIIDYYLNSWFKDTYVSSKLEKDLYSYKNINLTTKNIFYSNRGVEKGQIIGKMEVYYDEKLIDEINIISLEDKKNYDMIIVVSIIFIIFISSYAIYKYIND